MDKLFRLNSKEITTVLINIIGVKLFFTFPKRMIMNAGNAAWIQMIYVSLLMILIFWLSFKIYEKCGNVNILGLSERIGGKWLKALTGLLVTFVLFVNLATTMRSFPEMVKMVLLPKTPTEVILIVFAVVVGIAAFGGIDAISRMHAIFVPIVLGILAVFFLFLLPHIEIYNIFPIFGKGTYNIFAKGTLFLDFFDDIIILNLLLPHVKNMQEAKKAGMRAIMISGAAAVLILLLYCLVYPYPSSEKILIPVYQLTRLVGIGDFFQRFEAFFEFIWSFCIFLYSALYVAVICNVWKECFDLKYSTPLIFPIVAITTVTSFASHNMQDIAFGYRYVGITALVISFALPPILSIIYKKKIK